MDIGELQKPVGQLQILVYLYKNEKVPAKEIIHNVGFYARTTASALQHLEELQLVRKLKNDIYKLTARGKTVAKQLNIVAKLLE